MNERIRFERYRLMVISAWPDSAAKRAALASARAALEREIPFAPDPAASAQLIPVAVEDLRSAPAQVLR